MFKVCYNSAIKEKGGRQMELTDVDGYVVCDRCVWLTEVEYDIEWAIELIYKCTECAIEESEYIEIAH